MVRVGDVLRLERTRIEPDLAATYRQIGIYSWGKGVIENPPISGTQLSKVTYHRFPAGALLLSNIQAWEAAIAVSTEAQSRDFISSQRFLPYVPISPDEVNVRYLLDYFLSDAGMLKIRKASPGTITRNRTLGMQAFEDLVVPLPRRDQQEAIVERIDGCRAVARRRQASGDLLSALPVSMREMLLPGPGRCREVRLGLLLSEDSRKVAVDTGAIHPNIGVRNRGRGLFTKPPLVGGVAGATTLHPISAGQVLYSRLFAWEGSVAMVPPEYDGWFVSNEFPHFFVDDDLVDPGFLKAALQSNDFMDQIAVAGRGLGQRRKRVNVEAFLSLRIPLPDLDQQLVIGERLSGMTAIAQRASRLADLAEALPKAARNEIFSAI